MKEERELYTLLGLDLFTFEEAIPWEGEVTFTKVEAIHPLFKPFNGSVVTLTDEHEIIVYEESDVIKRFYIQEDKEFRKSLIAYLQSL